MNKYEVLDCINEYLENAFKDYESKYNIALKMQEWEDTSFFSGCQSAITFAMAVIKAVKNTELEMDKEYEDETDG